MERPSNKAIKLYVLELGCVANDLAWIVNNPNPGSLKHPNKASVWYQTPILAFLVIHPQGILLYDTGCNAEILDQRPPNLKNLFPFYSTEAERLENRLSEVGLQCKDVNIVVASHMHFDHAGNLHLFKDKRILVPKDDFTRGLVTTHSDPKYTGAYLKSSFDIEGMHYELLEEDMEILPGIELVILEGHVPSLLGLVVHLKESGTVICPSDAIPLRMNYGPPPRLPGAVYDSLGFERTIKKVRKLQKAYNAQIFYSHDKDQYEKELVRSSFYS